MVGGSLSSGLKKLQDYKEEKWRFTSLAELSGIIRRPLAPPTQVYLLLHGLNERGKRIYRKLLSVLPKDALILAPNAPFPVQRLREGRTTYGHSWYFYDKHEQRYFVNQDLAKYWLRDLLHMENPAGLPVTIIGFSQGGYLAPLVGKMIPETKLIIGIACEFRASLIEEPPPCPLVAIHGDADEIVKESSARTEVEKLKERNICVDFHSVKDAGHEINAEVAVKVKILLEAYGKRSL